MFSNKLVSAAELSAYLDGETEPSRRALLREHLRTSPADAQRIARWRQREEALRAAYAPAIREGAGPIAPLARSLNQKVFPRERRPEAKLSLTGDARNDAPIRTVVRPYDMLLRNKLLVVALLAFGAGAASMFAVTRAMQDTRSITLQYAPQTGAADDGKTIEGKTIEPGR